MEKKKIMLIGGAVAILAGAGYYLYSQKKKEATLPQLPSPPSNPTVSTLAIQAGPATPVNNVAASPATQAQVTAEYLSGKTWKVYNNTYSGKSLNIKVATDGTITIGDGYRGKIVGNTIVTYERNGVVRPDATVWTPLDGLSGYYIQ